MEKNQKYKTRRILTGITALLFALILTEAAIFFVILLKQADVVSGDAVVVFNGSVKRVAAGFQLANSGNGKWLLISPAKPETLENYRKQYGLVQNASFIVEDKARSTFENALYVARIVRQREIKRIVLVTEAYHMPRSYLLLKMTLFGSPARVSFYKVSTAGISGQTLPASLAAKLMYNEMVKMWGSLGEMMICKLKGKPAVTGLKQSWVINFLKDILLFDVSREMKDLRSDKKY
ncbi:MAG: YdcF family protein [Deltaproteobacteria bacterium]|nr:YdcF family protein [Deltaproteobacteria bacterium]